MPSLCRGGNSGGNCNLISGYCLTTKCTKQKDCERGSGCDPITNFCIQAPTAHIYPLENDYIMPCGDNHPTCPCGSRCERALNGHFYCMAMHLFKEEADNEETNDYLFSYFHHHSEYKSLKLKKFE